MGREGGRKAWGQWGEGQTGAAWRAEQASDSRGAIALLPPIQTPTWRAAEILASTMSRRPDTCSVRG